MYLKVNGPFYGHTMTDFLEQDDAIRGQNYVCLSFVSPEKILRNKDIFKMQSFLRDLVEKNNINLEQDYLDNLESKYKDFLYSRDDDLESQFYKENDFKTTVRGVKVRGVYDTLQEAQSRAKMLQSRDRNFNVYVGQVGFWLPWDPESHKVDHEEYADQALNNLVKKYKENKEKKDAHFRDNVNYAKEQAQIAAEQNRQKQQADKEKAAAAEVTPVNEVSEDIQNALNSDDIWLRRKDASTN